MLVRFSGLLAYASCAAALQCYDGKVDNGWECAGPRRFYNIDANQSEVADETAFDTTCCMQDACSTYHEGLVLTVYNTCPAGQSAIPTIAPEPSPSASASMSQLPGVNPANISPSASASASMSQLPGVNPANISPSASASSSPAASASVSPAASASGSPSVSASGSPAASASVSPAASASGSPSVSASGSPAASASVSPAASASGSPSVSASGSPSVSASGSLSVSASGSPSVSASGSPAASASGSPAASPSPYPTCDSYQCSVDNLLVLKMNAANIDCTSGVCDDAVCCDPQPTCASYTCTNSNFKQNSETIGCMYACDDVVCCDPYPNCESYDCGPGQRVADAANVDCVDGTCNDLLCCSAPSASPTPPSLPSTSDSDTPPWCKEVGSDLTNCESNHNCNISDPDCVCHKNKETDPLCAACHENYCDQCVNQATVNYKPVVQSRCINCQAVHNINEPGYVFECTQCDNAKGCVTGKLNGQTKNSNEFKVYEMEWFFDYDINNWSLRKTTGVAISSDQNYLNNYEASEGRRNGCTPGSNYQNQCINLTPTVLQYSWPDPPTTSNPTGTTTTQPSAVINEAAAPPKCLQSGNELTNCQNNNQCTSNDPNCVCFMNKETDPLCQNCQSSGYCQCSGGNTVSYSPAQNSRCVACSSLNSGAFTCDRCENNKGCSQGSISGQNIQTQNIQTQDMKVYEMEWFKKSANGEWALRRTTNIPHQVNGQDAGQNFMNSLQGNGCTDSQCNTHTETLFQLAYPG